MSSGIVNNSQKKYLYRDFTRFNIENNGITDTDNQVVINVLDCELPYIEEDRTNDVRIQFFHKSYYNIIIGLSIIDELLVRYDKDYLNQNLGKLFKHYSSNNCIIEDIDMLRELLIFSRDTYYNECSNYSKGLECGSLLDLVIITIHPLRFANIIRECLGINGYFSLVININSNMSKLSIDTLENCIRSKFNMDLSINIFYNENEKNDCFTKIKVINF